MPEVRRVGIFCQPEYILLNQIFGFQLAFEAMGIEVVTGYSFLNGGHMARFIDEFKPDFILEINRSRNQIPNFDDKIFHISWVWDHTAHDVDIVNGFGGSDLNYCFIDAKRLGYDDKVGRWDILLPAVDPLVFFPMGLDPRWDVTAIAHLCWPLTDADLNATIKFPGFTTTLREVIAEVEGGGLGYWNADMRVLKEILLRFIRRRNPVYRPDAGLMGLVGLFSNRVLRLERVSLMHAVLRATQNVAVFGTGYWRVEPKLSPHWGGVVTRYSDKNAINNMSSLVFHNGFGMHERVLEAMAAGRPVLVSRTPFDDAPGGLNQYFEPGRDFVLYDVETVEDVVRETLRDRERLRRIGENARARTVAEHTWRQRAEKILRDFHDR